MTEALKTTDESEPRTIEDLLKDVSDWAVVYCAPDTLVGRVESVRRAYEGQEPPDGVTLDPCFVCAGGYAPQMTQQGQVAGLGRLFIVGPIEFLSAPLRIDVRPSWMLQLGEFAGSPDYEILASKIRDGVRQAESMRAQAQAQMRAARAGVVLAGPGSVPAPQGFGGGPRR